MEYEYAAPVRVDFSSPLEDPDDHFFDRVSKFPLHEYQYKNRYEGVVVKTEVEEIEYEDAIQYVKEENSSPTKYGHRRRSMSVHVMQTTSYERRPTQNTDKTFGGSNRNLSRSQLTKKFASTCSLQSNLPDHNDKYVPTAEAIYRMENVYVPERFHTRSKNDVRAIETFNFNSHPTVPQSPALLSKTRIRPVTALSQKQKEALELEKIKQFKFKAHPLNVASLRGEANLPSVPRIPTTKPVPFNLTEFKKKNPSLEEKKETFKARPVPKHIFDRPAPVVKKPQATVPSSPKITKPRTKSLEDVLDGNRSKFNPFKLPMKPNIKLEGINGKVGHTGVPISQKPIVHPVKPMPFSFEQKDKERERKKKEKIQKILKEEKEKREFHANPVPKSIVKKARSDTSQSSDAKKDNKENVPDNKCHKFKARPPTVLHKEPFVPVRSERVLLEPVDINMTTEKRAKEREAFNQKLKEKEQILETMQKLKEQRQKEEEEREVAALRAQLIHKANKPKLGPPFVVHPSDAPVTVPKSPNFSHK